MGNSDSVTAEKEDFFLRRRFGSGNADQLLVKLIADEFGDVSGSRSPRSVSDRAQNIARRLRRKLFSRNEEEAPTDRAQSSASCISYVAETEADDLMDAPATQQTTYKFSQLRRLHTQPENEPFTAIVELSPQSQKVNNPGIKTETTMNDDNDLRFNNSSIAKDDAQSTVLVSEIETGTSNDDVKSVCTGNEANKEGVKPETISNEEHVFVDQEQATIFSDVPDMSCEKEVIRNYKCIHQKEEQEIDKISDIKVSKKEALGTTETKQYDVSMQIRQTSFKHKIYVDRNKAIAGVDGDVASKPVLLDEAVMSDTNVIRKVQLPNNNTVLSSNMFCSRKHDTPSVKETCSSQTNEDNAVETPRPQLEAFKVVPAKKYGGMEHMMQIKLENDIRMKRMKIITTSRRISDYTSGRTACDNLNKFDTNVIRNIQVSRQGNDYSSNMISPKTIPCHRSELANMKEEFTNSMHALTVCDLSALSENAISRYKVNRSPMNRSVSDGHPMYSTQDNHTKQAEANQSFDTGNLKYVIQENSNDCAVIEGHKQDSTLESMPSSQRADDEVLAASYIQTNNDDNPKHVPDGKTDGIDDDMVQTTTRGSCKGTAISQTPHTHENVDTIHIIPAKKYGSLEHMKTIAMENAVNMRRLKNITASGSVTSSAAPKAGSFAVSDVSLPGQTRQSRRDDESDYDKNAAENRDCVPTSCKPNGHIDVYDMQYSGHDVCEPVSGNSHRPPSDVNVDAAHIIPAKKYGGLEHMQTIKMENAIKLRRLKNVQASSHVQRSQSTSSKGISHINTSELQDNDLANEISDCPKGGNQTGHRFQTWHTPDKEFSYSKKQADEKQISYGSVAHFQKIQRDNAERLRYMKGIHKRVDTWKTVERSCSDQDPGKETEYGSVAHFKMIQRKNATRNQKMNAITSKLDTWKEPNSGSDFSMHRQSNLGAVGDPRKFGSVANFQQSKQQNASRTSRLKQVTSKLNTWQPRLKMAALLTPGQMSMSRNFGQTQSLTMGALKATSKIDTGLVKASKSAGGHVASWSRHLKDVRSPNPNKMNTTITAYSKFSNVTMSCTSANHKRESNETKAALLSQRRDASVVTRQRSDRSAVRVRKPEILPAQNVGNDGISLSAREYESILNRLRHPDSKIRFPCTEAEVYSRLSEMLKLLRVSIFAKTTRPSTCEGIDGYRGFYVSPCDCFLADEAAMELEYEMEQRALIAGNDLVNFVPRLRPTINRHGAPPTKIPRPVFSVLEKIMQSRVRLNNS